IEKVVGIVRWQTFTYDCENRLVKTETMADTQVESTSSYQYDSLGRRVAKQSEIKGQTDHKRFLWQGLRMLREESPGQSSLYLYEPGSYAPLARVDEKEGEVENKVYYFHTDQIGTPLEMTDAEGQIVWQAKYRAWGAVEKLVVDEVEQNLRFQGQYFDAETGLHYNTFRYYDPEIGRFITQDPIGLAGGYNLYQYNINPIRWIDVTGLAGCTLIKADAVDHDYLLRLKRSEYPETFGHIQDAINGGQPYMVTIQRDAAKLNRKTSLKDVKTMKSKDRDEWPMAMFKEGGNGASVRHIDPSDNRGAGSSIGNLLSSLPNGTKIKVEVF
ncbi:RHS repeat-associated core domain-containing protein, partial [Pseudomonas syringae]